MTLTFDLLTFLLGSHSDCETCCYVCQVKVQMWIHRHCYSQLLCLTGSVTLTFDLLTSLSRSHSDCETCYYVWQVKVQMWILRHCCSQLLCLTGFIKLPRNTCALIVNISTLSAVTPLKRQRPSGFVMQSFEWVVCTINDNTNSTNDNDKN